MQTRNGKKLINTSHPEIEGKSNALDREGRTAHDYQTLELESMTTGKIHSIFPEENQLLQSKLEHQVASMEAFFGRQRSQTQIKTYAPAIIPQSAQNIRL